MSTGQHTIVLVGCGKMGAALLRNWVTAKIPARFHVIEPHDIDNTDVRHFRTIGEAIEPLAAADVIILAVKPQSINDVCAQLKELISPKALVLSIAAGRTLAGFASLFGAAQPVVRA
jgi:pyrroline-5-carboxylate reductase